MLDDPQLELVLPDKAEITSVSSSLLRPGGIDDLWKTPQITVGATRAFFDGTHAMTVARGGYDEPMPVPRVPAPVVDEAVQAAVKEGAVWFTIAEASSSLAPPAPASDTRASREVALRPSQLQDFVDVLPDILKATAGLEMSFRVTVEVKGKERPPDKMVASINKLLESVDENLRVQ